MNQRHTRSEQAHTPQSPHGGSEKRYFSCLDCWANLYTYTYGPNFPLYRLPRKQRDCELGVGVSQAHVALRAHRAPDELGGPCGVGLPLD